MADIKIYSGRSQVRAMEIKNLLQSIGVKYYEINKLDSAYAGILGELELYVDEADADKARDVIASTENDV